MAVTAGIDGVGLEHARASTNPTAGGGITNAGVLTLATAGLPGEVQPLALACTWYEPAIASQWKAPDGPVVSGLTAGVRVPLDAATGANDCVGAACRRRVTVAPLTGFPAVSSTVPLGSMKNLQ